MATDSVYAIEGPQQWGGPYLDLRADPNASAVNWRTMRDILAGITPVTQYSPARLVVNHPQAADRDYYSDDLFTLFSKRAVDLIRPYSSTCLGFLEASINDAPYFFIYQTGTCDFLDVGSSNILSSPPEVWGYRFKKQEIPEYCVFAVPEDPLGCMFCTAAVEQQIHAASLNGFFLRNAETGDPARPANESAAPAIALPQTVRGSVGTPFTIEQRLDILEEELEITLPIPYRNFMVNYPAVLADTPAVGSIRERISDLNFFRDIDWIAVENENMRGEICSRDGSLWPDQYLVIGTDGCGSYWCIDTLAADCSVILFDNAFMRFEVRHASLEAFANWLVVESNRFRQEHRNS